MEDIKKRFELALINNDKIEAQRIIEEDTDSLLPESMVSEIIVPALENIGDYWQEGSIALSQIYLSGRICESLIDDLLPPSSRMQISQPKMAITVLDDYHFLGKRIIYSHLRSAGYDLIDYGRKNVDELVEAICKDDIKVIFISTLMYPSALNIRKVRERVLSLDKELKIVVGGAPFNMDDKLWSSVGADAMGRNGGEAIDYLNKNMEAVV